MALRVAALICFEYLFSIAMRHGRGSPRAFQLLTIGCVAPSAFARLLTPPSKFIAKVRIFMLRVYHYRNTLHNTKVKLFCDLIPPMQESPGKILKRLRAEKRLTQTQLSRLAGVSQSTIGNIEVDIRGYGDSVVAIAKALDVSPDTLLGGVPSYNNPETTNTKKIVTHSRVPLISWVSAGNVTDMFDAPQAADDHPWIECYYSKPSRSSYALSVEGDSMTNPVPGATSFPHGTIIIVDTDAATKPGDYVIAKDVSTQKATFKQLMTDGSRWYLRALNTVYQAIEIDDPLLRVIGRVIEFQPPGGKL